MNLNSVGIVLRPKSSFVGPIFEEIAFMLEKENIFYAIDGHSSKMLSDKYQQYAQDFYDICNSCDIIFSIGGDGTLISCARKSYGYQIPILGIHIGTLGFLTAIMPKDIQWAIKQIREDNYFINKYLMLELSIENNLSEFQPMHCVNEFLLTRSGLNGMVEIDAFVDSVSDENMINNYKLDSLIVATPTGSSAYNTSAGGSVVYPHCENILITPVCAHSLTQRPLILSANFKLYFRFKTAGSIFCDGQQRISIPKDSIVSISVAKHSYKLIQFEKNFYFNRLKNKFGWGK